MKYIIIMWALCLFITGRHVYLHRQRTAETWPNASTPTEQWATYPEISHQSVVSGGNVSTGTTRGGAGGSFTMTAGSGGVASVCDVNGNCVDERIYDRANSARVKSIKRMQRKRR
jgi:hypothetical protein